jgi:hypothetical protein
LINTLAYFETVIDKEKSFIILSPGLTVAGPVVGAIGRGIGSVSRRRATRKAVSWTDPMGTNGIVCRRSFVVLCRVRVRMFFKKNVSSGSAT